MKRIISALIVTAYYTAALLLLWAGISKLTSPGIGDILEILYEKEQIGIHLLIFVARWFPLLEISVALFALTGIWANYTAKIMGILYLFFTLLILYVSEGYLLLPIDCGCFGDTTNSTPAYLLLLRNGIIAVLLFLFTYSYRKYTLFFLLTDRH